MAGLRGLIVFLIANVVAGEIKNIGWWRHAVFYQVYPRSFRDDNNDGIGDLKGIASKMDHFKDAGVDGIWLSPIYASPMKDFGYDISDFKKIHPDYGTDDDFKQVATRAKELGIKLILDLVPNHVSDQHQWFNESLAGNPVYRDYFVWHPGKSVTENNITTVVPPNNWISVFGKSAWTWVESRKAYYFHQFLPEQPDLNYRNTEVRKAMQDVIRYWLDKGVDGFRIDAVPHLFEAADFRDEPRSGSAGATSEEYEYLDHVFTKDLDEAYELVASWRKVLDEYANSTNTDEKVMMTEAYASFENTTRYYDAGSHVPFNFQFIIDITSTSKPNQYKSVIDDWILAASNKSGAPNWVMGNHDRSRTETRYAGRGDQMTMLAMILPGVAVTYYGEEIGMMDKTDISYADTQDPQGCIAGPDKYKQKSRDPNRTPMQWDNSTNAGFNNGSKPWIPIHDSYQTVNLAAQKTAATSHYKNYQQLIQLRKTFKPLRSGSTEVVADNDTLAVIRSLGTESVILVINFSDNKNVTVNLAPKLPSGLSSAAKIQVATLDSSLKAGADVDLRKLTIASKQSLIVLANTEETDGGSAAISSALSLVILAILSPLLLR